MSKELFLFLLMNLYSRSLNKEDRYYISVIFSIFNFTWEMLENFNDTISSTLLKYFHESMTEYGFIYFPFQICFLDLLLHNSITRKKTLICN